MNYRKHRDVKRGLSCHMTLVHTYHCGKLTIHNAVKYFLKNLVVFTFYSAICVARCYLHKFYLLFLSPSIILTHGISNIQEVMKIVISHKILYIYCKHSDIKQGLWWHKSKEYSVDCLFNETCQVREFLPTCHLRGAVLFTLY